MKSITCLIWSFVMFIIKPTQLRLMDSYWSKRSQTTEDDDYWNHYRTGELPEFTVNFHPTTTKPTTTKTIIAPWITHTTKTLTNATNITNATTAYTIPYNGTTIFIRVNKANYTKVYELIVPIEVFAGVETTITLAQKLTHANIKQFPSEQFTENPKSNNKTFNDKTMIRQSINKSRSNTRFGFRNFTEQTRIHEHSDSLLINNRTTTESTNTKPRSTLTMLSAQTTTEAEYEYYDVKTEPFSKFLENLLNVCAKKNVTDARVLFNELHFQTIRLAEDKELVELGPVVLNYMRDSTTMIESPTDSFQRLLAFGHHALKNRKASVSFNINSFLTFMDSIYLAEEEEAMQFILNETMEYPTGTKDAPTLITELLDVLVVKPIRRLGRTEKQKFLVEALTKIIENTKNKKIPPIRRYFTGKKRFNVVGRKNIFETVEDEAFVTVEKKGQRQSDVTKLTKLRVGDAEIASIKQLNYQDSLNEEYQFNRDFFKKSKIILSSKNETHGLSRHFILLTTKSGNTFRKNSYRNTARNNVTLDSGDTFEYSDLVDRLKDKLYDKQLYQHNEKHISKEIYKSQNNNAEDIRYTTSYLRGDQLAKHTKVILSRYNNYWQTKNNLRKPFGKNQLKYQTTFKETGRQIIKSQRSQWTSIANRIRNSKYTLNGNKQINTFVNHNNMKTSQSTKQFRIQSNKHQQIYPVPVKEDIQLNNKFSRAVNPKHERDKSNNEETLDYSNIEYVNNKFKKVTKSGALLRLSKKILKNALRLEAPGVNIKRKPNMERQHTSPKIEDKNLHSHQISNNNYNKHKDIRNTETQSSAMLTKNTPIINRTTRKPLIKSQLFINHQRVTPMQPSHKDGITKLMSNKVDSRDISMETLKNSEEDASEETSESEPSTVKETSEQMSIDIEYLPKKPVNISQTEKEVTLQTMTTQMKNTFISKNIAKGFKALTTDKLLPKEPLTLTTEQSTRKSKKHKNRHLRKVIQHVHKHSRHDKHNRHRKGKRHDARNKHGIKHGANHNHRVHKSRGKHSIKKMKYLTEHFLKILRTDSVIGYPQYSEEYNDDEKKRYSVVRSLLSSESLRKNLQTNENNSIILRANLNSESELSNTTVNKLKKIIENSAYSDDESELKNNLYDALRHKDMRRQMGNLFTPKINEFRQESSYSDDEAVIKRNIYKAIAVKNRITKNNVTKVQKH